VEVSVENTEEAYTLARAAWPEVDLPASQFRAYVAQCGFPSEQFASEVLADLYLSCACANAVPGAVEAFKRTFADGIRSAARICDTAAAFAVGAGWLGGSPPWPGAWP
jgi:hypothetical protein